MICYDSNICVTKILFRPVVEFYNLYLNQRCGGRLSNTTRQLFYWKGLVMKS